MTYNISNITSATTPWAQFNAVNELSGGLFVGLMILSLYIVLFVVFRHHGTRASMLGISFIMAIVAIGAFVLGLIGWSIAVIPIVALVFSLIVYKLT